MVRLYKVPSEFNVCRMRDSFLRQFTEQAAPENAAATGADDRDDVKELVVSGGGAAAAAAARMRSVTTLCRQRYKSSAVSAQRKLAVHNIIRYGATHAAYLISEIIWL